MLLVGMGLVPIRHQVTVEAHPRNPVTRVRVMEAGACFRWCAQAGG
ncbi:MAG: hypothetical protein IPP58_07420 [Holophagaceae bacterium]|uniref:Uncharacterized protein n=1 Tax=Candidatus Geothrix skivensis TaxID=2954439 RepID=A0A9D7SG94_9BACT|nr:hypothetical protein [Candidatus Geothrix skivensis]